MIARALRLTALLVVLAGACATSHVERRTVEVTAYCPCHECIGRRFARFTARTASGTWPRPVNAGLLSLNSVVHPWMIPVRIALPWLLFPRAGTVAADTAFYPFGTQIHVPGYGWGVVEDCGADIRGPDRLDIFMRTHRQAQRWGRQWVTVEIRR
jgi:hypothetical protein